MKKYIIILVLIFNFSCKAKKEVLLPKKIYRTIDNSKEVLLPKKIYRTIDNSKEMIEEFFYDGRKLSKINFYHNNEIVHHAYFKYDDNLITSIDYIDNNILDEIKFIYDKNDILIREVYKYNQKDSLVTDFKTISINEIQSKANRIAYNSVSYKTMFFSGNNINYSTSNDGNVRTTYEYDTQFSPFINVIGFHKQVSISGIEFWERSENNILKERIEHFKSIIAIAEYSYKYNEKGYPTIIEYFVKQGCEECEGNRPYIYEIEYVIFANTM